MEGGREGKELLLCSAHCVCLSVCLSVCCVVDDDVDRGMGEGSTAVDDMGNGRLVEHAKCGSISCARQAGPPPSVQW